MAITALIFAVAAAITSVYEVFNEQQNALTDFGYSVASPVVCPDCPTATASTCTTTINKTPSYNTDCTFYAYTQTNTASIFCGGCALTTHHLGNGLVWCSPISDTQGAVTDSSLSPASTRRLRWERRQQL